MSRPKIHVLPSSPLVKALLPWAIGDGLTNRLPNLILVAGAYTILVPMRVRGPMRYQVLVPNILLSK